MSERPSDWIAAAGVRRVVGDPAEVDVPLDVIADQDPSLIARGLYALLLTQQGQPMDPYEDAWESERDLKQAIEELIATGLAVRITSRSAQPRDAEAH